MTAALMFFENVPLITTDKLGEFFNSVPIAHHYGDLTRSRIRCQKIESNLWLVAAHPCEITACFIDKAKTLGFVGVTRVDRDNVTRQYITLTSPPSGDNPIVEVALRGKRSSKTGNLIENPDEIIEDIAALCGRTLNFPLFREQCNKRGLRAAGSVDELRSLRSYVNDIIESFGARWLGDSAVFYPPTEGYAKSADPISVSHAISTEDVAGKIIVYYSWNQSEGRHGAYIELSAVGAQYDNQGIIYAKWLRLARDAESLARRTLAKRAGSFVKTSATLKGIVRAGSVVSISDANFEGPLLVLTAEPEEVSTVITGEIILAPHEVMVVSQFSNENNTSRSENVDVLLDTVKHEATITVRDIQNRPMVGILVTYDGSVTKQTNKLGQVTFSISTGAHTLVLQGEGIENNDPYPLLIP